MSQTSFSLIHQRKHSNTDNAGSAFAGRAKRARGRTPTRGALTIGALASALLLGAAACGGGGGTGDGGNGGNGGGADGGTGGGGDGGALHFGPNRHACAIDKPQKVYGYALNAKAILDTDEVWTPDNVYLVFGPFHVPTSLTIMAGTNVCFDYGPPDTEGSAEPPPGELIVEQGGTLRALGSASQHVLFTQKNDEHQYWGGVRFGVGSNTSASTMQYVDIYNGGLSASGPVLSTFSDPTMAPLDLQNVTFYSVQRVGLEVLTAGFTPASTVLLNNYADETALGDLMNGYPALRVHVYGAKTVTASTFAVGSSVPASVSYVQLDHATGANLDQDVTLHALSGKLVWHTVSKMKMDGTTSQPPTLRIEAGATVAMAGNIYIGDGGTSMANLVVAGTASKPVTFTSDAFISGSTPMPGDWGTIMFSPGNFDASVSSIANAVFEYGAGQVADPIYNCNDQGGAGELSFTIASNGMDYMGPSVTSSRFRQSAGNGVRFRCNVGHSDGCLTTDYTQASFMNTFEGFSSTTPAENPLTCP